ncbi:unnamed protein product, partial [marine sediment metagenome]
DLINRFKTICLGANKKSIHPKDDVLIVFGKGELEIFKYDLNRFTDMLELKPAKRTVKPTKKRKNNGTKRKNKL